MSMRPHGSQAPASAPEDLVELLKAAANDVVLIRDIIGSNDIDSVAAAFAALLNGGSPSAPNESALQKKTRNRPCRSMPTETFVEVVLFADRDTLDTVQLVCSYLLNFIRERELTQLPLRAIPKVIIGRSFGRYEGGDEYWLPVAETVRDRSAGKELIPKSLHHLATCLRLSFCLSVCINLIGTPEMGEPSRILCGVLFNDLIAPNTLVGTLIIATRLGIVEAVTRGINAFKSVKSVCVESRYADFLPSDFFVSVAGLGVRNIEYKATDGGVASAYTADALSFGFAEPAAGGDRSLLGVTCSDRIGSDLLAQIKQKVAELPAAHHVDFVFKLTNVSSQIDSAGFEKYHVDDGLTWLMDDLENHVNVEVKLTEEALVEVHVFSSG